MIPVHHDTGGMGAPYHNMVTVEITVCILHLHMLAGLTMKEQPLL